MRELSRKTIIINGIEFIATTNYNPYRKKYGWGLTRKDLRFAMSEHHETERDARVGLAEQIEKMKK